MTNLAENNYVSEFLPVSWGVSRARDTDGYNICRIKANGKLYRTLGGGYDMVGTVLGDWLADNFQTQLTELTAYYDMTGETCTVDKTGFYGLYKHKDHISIDGGCGVESVKTIADAINVSITESYGKNQKFLGFFVSYGGE